jgi:hypothetical protein
LPLIIWLASGCGSEPGRLTGSGPGTTPNPTGGSVTVLPELTAKNVYYSDSISGLAVFLGEIVNDPSGSDACDIVITLKVTLLNSLEETLSIPLQGRVKLLSGKTNFQCLEKGETGSFHLTTDIPALLIEDFEITSVVSEYKNIGSPLLGDSLALVGALQQETTPENRVRYSGTLINNDTVDTAYFPFLTLTVLDADGIVSGVFTVYLNPDLIDPSAVCRPDGVDIPCLPPGESLPFSIDTDVDPLITDDFYLSPYWMEAPDFI